MLRIDKKENKASKTLYYSTIQVLFRIILNFTLSENDHHKQHRKKHY